MQHWELCQRYALAPVKPIPAPQRSELGELNLTPMPNLTKEQIKSNLEAYEDWLNGKSIECCQERSNEWLEINSDQFFCHRTTQYRTVHTPTLRPWKPEEVPLGARLKRKDDNNITYLIIGVASDRLYTFTASFAFHQLLVDWEHSTDNGKTWYPCGVME